MLFLQTPLKRILPMNTSRQKILLHLTKTRSASAREIARALKLSAPNVRHHITVLCSDGRVEMTAIRDPDGRGRPEKLYSLSQSAQGDNLSALVDALLDEKMDAEKLGERMAILQKLADTVGTGSMAKRLSLLVEKLNTLHYRSHWEAGSEGPRLIFGHCPYAKVVASHPELCLMDASMLSAALGRPVNRLQKNESGLPGTCPFLFQIG